MLPVLIANIGLGHWPIGTEGATGAAIASSASYAVATGIYIVFYSFETGIRLVDIVFLRRSDLRLLKQQITAVLKHIRPRKSAANRPESGE